MESTQIPQPEPKAAFFDKVPLFSPAQIGAGAFFGTLVASGWLARANFIAMGEKKKGDLALLGGILVTILIMGAAIVLPEGTPGVMFTIPQIAIAMSLGKKYFDERMSTAERVSNWRVALVCLLTLFLVVAAFFCVFAVLIATGLVNIDDM